MQLPLHAVMKAAGRTMTRLIKTLEREQVHARQVQSVQNAAGLRAFCCPLC